MKKLLITAAAVLGLSSVAAFADTKTMFGCEWKQADNGNYWFRVDGGCPMHVALGYGSANEMRGKDVPPETVDDEDPGEDSGESSEASS